MQRLGTLQQHRWDRAAGSRRPSKQRRGCTGRRDTLHWWASSGAGWRSPGAQLPLMVQGGRWCSCLFNTEASWGFSTQEEGKPDEEDPTAGPGAWLLQSWSLTSVDPCQQARWKHLRVTSADASRPTVRRHESRASNSTLSELTRQWAGPTEHVLG